jgi:hypothetical protein
MQIAVLPGANAWCWVIVPYHMEQLQGRYRHSEMKEYQVPTYFTVDALCP